MGEEQSPQKFKMQNETIPKKYKFPECDKAEFWMFFEFIESEQKKADKKFGLKGVRRSFI